MALTPILGNLFTIQLKQDGISTYKNLVCQSDYSLKYSTPNSVTQTNCGPLLAIGVPAWTLTVNAVFNPGYSTAAELSSTQVMAFQAAGALLDFIAEYPLTGSVGAQYLRSGTCYVTDVTETASTTEFIKFAVTLTGTGNLTIAGA